MATAPEGTFRVGPFTARPRLGELDGPDGTLHVEPKVMGVFACLARHAGETVTPDQFMEEVWDGRFVSDEALTRCISNLRAHLGDNPRKPRYIRTITRIGYQLMKDVEWLDTPSALQIDPQPATTDDGQSGEPGDGSVSPDAPRPWRMPRAGIVAIAAAAVAIVMAIIVVSPGRPPVSIAPSSLAVLPFTNMSDDADNEYLSDGLTEDLINRMANLPGLQVVGSTTAFTFKGQPIDVRTVGEQLSVAHVIQGSVRKDGDRVRITASLTDTDTTFVLWSQQFDRLFSDFFSVQDEISTSIVEELRPQLAIDGLPEPVSAPTNIMDAYTLVLRGRSLLRTREETPIRESIELFRQAIGLDPHLAEAYRDLASAYAILPTYSTADPDDMFSLAEQALDDGVGMDPTLDEKVYDVRAFLHYNRWQWIEGEQDFKRALELTPTDSNLLQWYSQQLAAAGKLDDALQSVLRAVELDTRSPAINQRVAVMYQWLDDDEQAHRYFELADEWGLSSTANLEGYAVHLIRHRHYDEARQVLTAFQREFESSTDWVGPFIAALRDPSLRPEAIEALLAARGAGQVNLKYLEGLLAIMGDADAAIDVAFELLNDPLDFELEFFFARENAQVRAHPRFGELVRRTGLPAYWDEYGWPPMCQRQGDDIVCL